MTDHGMECRDADPDMAEGLGEGGGHKRLADLLEACSMCDRRTIYSTGTAGRLQGCTKACGVAEVPMWTVTCSM